MRISTNQIYNVANTSMLDAQSAINKTQQQISTGREVLTPADDPVAATKIMQLNQVLSEGKQFQKNIDLAENKLSLEEVGLQSITNLLQRVRELTVAAGNTATLSPAEYNSLAVEIDVRIDEALGLMNSQTANGEYVFAGFKGQDKPFVADGGGGFSYVGDEGQQKIQVSTGSTIAVSDSGKALFVDVTSSQSRISTSALSTNTSNPAITIDAGEVFDQDIYDDFYPQDMLVTFSNGPAFNYTITEPTSGKIIVPATSYTSGQNIEVNGARFRMVGTPVNGDGFRIDSSNTQSILSTMAELSKTFKDNDGSAASKAEMARVVANSLGNFDNAITNVSRVQAEIGARQNTLSSTKGQHMDADIFNQEVLSDLQDVDFSEAATRLQMQSFILQAAQQSFVKVSGLSLFNFLR